MTNIKTRKHMFWLLVIILMLSVTLFPLMSEYIHVITQTPQVHNAEIDLSNYNTASIAKLPLNGAWEFYPSQWICSDRAREEAELPASTLVEVPKSWKTYPGFSLPSHGYASFRLQLKNCQPNMRMLVYIPHINSSYRVFIGGELVAEYGDMVRIKHEFEEAPPPSRLVATSETIHNLTFPGGNMDLVIELSSPYVGGLYRVPFLTTPERYYQDNNFHDLLVAGLTGVIVVTLASLLLILFSRGNYQTVLPLIFMDIIVLLRILFQNNYLAFLDFFLPIDTYYVNTLMQAIMLFLPLIFLYCAHSLVQVFISRKYLLGIALYEIAFMPVIIVCAWQGRPQLQFTVCLISYLPFLPIIQKLYCCICKRVRYSIMVHSIFVFILCSMIISAMNSAGFLNILIPLVPATFFAISLLLQLWLYLRRNLDIQQQAMEAENLRLRLRQSETSLMLSQIKPHFLYNTLIAIQVLCKTQPDLAAETVMKFSKFLRTNMNFISSHQPIPFEKELEHIYNYTDIEKLRFQKRLEVLFDIQTTDFLVPPLSIQPLVENAIRHGACKKVQGGTVTLRTSEREDGFLIEIIDDGDGFSPQSLPEEDVPHGLQNVMFRLDEVMHAKVEIHSVLGSGTTVCVLLPRKAAALPDTPETDLSGINQSNRL